MIHGPLQLFVRKHMLATIAAPVTIPATASQATMPGQTITTGIAAATPAHKSAINQRRLRWAMGRAENTHDQKPATPATPASPQTNARAAHPN